MDSIVEHDDQFEISLPNMNLYLHEDLKKRHFRLKLYEYCFRIIYANHPLKQWPNSILRSRSLGDIQFAPKQNQRNWSSLSLEKGVDLFLLYELNRRNRRRKSSKKMDKFEESYEDRWIEEVNKRPKIDKFDGKEEEFEDLWIEKVRKNPKIDRVYKEEDLWIEEIRKKPKIDRVYKEEESDDWIEKSAKLSKSTIDPQKEQAPRFKYLKKSSKSLKIVKHAKEGNPTEDFNEIGTNIGPKFNSNRTINKSKPVEIVHNDYSKRFSSIPVFSQRSSTLPKRRNKVEREIEADRKALKEFAVDRKKVVQKVPKVEKKLKIKNLETPAESARSWLSEKKEMDNVIDENEVNFERSWSAWSLKKAELLEWDPDFDFQPIGPQQNSIRQKYYKDALIKESNEIEKKRKCALENTMIFAQIRSEQLMKSSNPQKIKPKMKLPVEKLIKEPEKVSNVPENSKEDDKKEDNNDGKISIFAQIKKALHNVPEKIKEILSFGGGDKNEPEVKKERSHSITNIEVNQKVEEKIRKRPLSAGDGKRCSKYHPNENSNTSIDLHKHNKKVEATLGNVLILKDKKPTLKTPEPTNLKIPSKIAKTANSKRKPIGWRSSQDADKLDLAKKELGEKHQNDIKLPKITTSDNDRENQQKLNVDKPKLPAIPKQNELFDPIGNAYRSAGRKYSPIPMTGWPTSKSFNPEVGRCKIIDYIEQNWEYKKPQLAYRVEHYHASNIEDNKQRFKYRVCWNSNKSQQEGIVFFNVDVSRIETSEPIQLSYRFLGQHQIHRAKFSPTATPYRKRWLRSLAEGYVLPK